MKSWRARLTTGAILLSFLGGCELLGPDSDAAQISLLGVEGVRFGETRAAVWEALEGPTSSYSIAHGTGRTWISEVAQAERYDGLRFYFEERPGESWDTYVLDFFAIYAPYDGRTAHGIGIGSTRRELDRAYGEPRREVIHGSGGTANLDYCLGPRNMEVATKADTVVAIFLGYHTPLPTSPVQCSD